MNVEFITKQDLYNLKTEILSEIKALGLSPTQEKEWLKSSDVQKILNCSAGTLQNLRISGRLPFTKVCGTIYYRRSDVTAMLNAR